MKYDIVFETEIGNTYGGLSLVRALAPRSSELHKEGDLYLCMDDCFGPDFAGPLTEAQVQAFHVLFNDACNNGEQK